MPSAAARSQKTVGGMVPPTVWNRICEEELLDAFPVAKLGALFDPGFDEGFFGVGDGVGFAFGRHGEVIIDGEGEGFEEPAGVGFAGDNIFVGVLFAAFHDAFGVVEAEAVFGFDEFAVLGALLLVALEAFGLEDGEDLFGEVDGGGILGVC